MENGLGLLPIRDSRIHWEDPVCNGPIWEKETFPSLELLKQGQDRYLVKSLPNLVRPYSMNLELKQRLEVKTSCSRPRRYLLTSCSLCFQSLCLWPTLPLCSRNIFLNTFSWDLPDQVSQDLSEPRGSPGQPFNQTHQPPFSDCPVTTWLSLVIGTVALWAVRSNCRVLVTHQSAPVKILGHSFSPSPFETIDKKFQKTPRDCSQELKLLSQFFFIKKGKSRVANGAWWVQSLASMHKALASIPTSAESGHDGTHLWSQDSGDGSRRIRNWSHIRYTENLKSAWATCRKQRKRKKKRKKPTNKTKQNPHKILFSFSTSWFF